MNSPEQRIYYLTGNYHFVLDKNHLISHCVYTQ
nr:MAG TPA: hypothetical protein [Caudoviricetes sp.]